MYICQHTPTYAIRGKCLHTLYLLTHTHLLVNPHSNTHTFTNNGRNLGCVHTESNCHSISHSFSVKPPAVQLQQSVMQLAITFTADLSDAGLKKLQQADRSPCQAEAVNHVFQWSTHMSTLPTTQLYSTLVMLITWLAPPSPHNPRGLNVELKTETA